MTEVALLLGKGLLIVWFAFLLTLAILMGAFLILDIFDRKDKD